jgi:hypothetical protein
LEKQEPVMEFGNVVHLKLNEVWKREATNFTPWIAERVSEIGNLLGYEFEHLQQEAPVGDFSLDILAKDLGTNRFVVIENQYGRTDHDHLGKLLTYTAGYNAKIIIIISEEFRDEHKKALEWLNENTNSDVEFYGLSVSVFKIDDSKPAYSFNIVVAPNEWQKSTIEKVVNTSSERSERYQQFYQSVLDDLREKKFSNAKKAQPQNWYTFTSGIPGYGLGLSFSKNSTARVELYIDCGDTEKNKERFDKLLGQKEKIESEIKEKLLWERLDNKQASRVAVEIEGTIHDSDEELEKIRSWMIDRIVRFKAIFPKFLR